MDEFTFAGYPTAWVHETPNGKKIDHLLWGDFIRKLGPEIDGWINVRARGTTGWMRKSETQDERLLEVNFVDIGQGDGCFIVTPDDKFMLIDAGEGDNMIRFLRWRFNLKKHTEQVVTIQNAIISHPDSDHYRGFVPLFNDPQFRFENIYHSGIVERAGDNSLGAREIINGIECIEAVTNLEELKNILQNPQNVGRALYMNLLKTAATEGRVQDIRQICAAIPNRPICFLPGYEENANGKLTIEVLGPVMEQNTNGRNVFKWIKDKGKTKNGHSIVLKFKYGKVSLLLGGDLNIPAENHLMQFHTGKPEPKTPQKIKEFVKAAKEIFQADIAKACHHGSADFSTLFLQAVNPIATVISSGDDEPHAHPRPDTLGTIGKYARGDRPLIFSTELARSTKETIKNPNALRREIRELFDLREKAENEEVRDKLDAKISKLLESFERTVSVFGLINVRTDGQKAVIAQKLEARTARGEWDLYELTQDAHGNLQFVSEH